MCSCSHDLFLSTKGGVCWKIFKPFPPLYNSTLRMCGRNQWVTVQFLFQHKHSPFYLTFENDVCSISSIPFLVLSISLLPLPSLFYPDSNDIGSCKNLFTFLWILYIHGELFIPPAGLTWKPFLQFFSSLVLFDKLSYLSLQVSVCWHSKKWMFSEYLLPKLFIDFLKKTSKLFSTNNSAEHKKFLPENVHLKLLKEITHDNLFYLFVNHESKNLELNRKIFVLIQRWKMFMIWVIMN